MIVLVWAVHHAAAVAQRAQWALWTARSAAQWAARAAEGATTAAAPFAARRAPSRPVAGKMEQVALARAERWHVADILIDWLLLYTFNTFKYDSC